MGAVAGGASRSDPTAPLDGIREEFDAAIIEAQTRVKLPDKNHKDRHVERAVRQQFKSGKIFGRGYRVKRIWTSTPTWTIAYSYGTPVSRNKRGHVLVQIEKERFCRLYALTVVQPYTGAGRYQSPGTTTVTDRVKVVGCT